MGSSSKKNSKKRKNSLTPNSGERTKKQVPKNGGICVT